MTNYKQVCNMVCYISYTEYLTSHLKTTRNYSRQVIYAHPPSGYPKILNPANRIQTLCDKLKKGDVV
jgi:hypothetical protein